ncbi:MAG: hypothetical protein RJA44_2496 [Pseudomonadota bacterium]
MTTETRKPGARPVALLALLLGALALGGCASKIRLDPPAPVEDRANPSSTATLAPIADAGANGAGTSQSRVATVDLAAGRNGAGGAGSGVPGRAGAGNGRTVYFDYDSLVIKDEYRPVIDVNAKWLNADRKRGMVLEGHTDERGGSEYNLALGQKRAEAVGRALGLLGVKPNQIEPVSFGKERPVDAASNEAAWAKNRRVELKER